MCSRPLVVLDLGGVIFNADFDRTFLKWGVTLGLAKEEVRRRFCFDERFAEFERGLITPEEYHLHISNKLNIRLSFLDFVSGWNAIYGNVLPGVESCLPIIRRRARLVALTNTNEIHAQIWPDKYASVLSSFEDIYSSAQIGFRKPDVESFQHVLDSCGARPEETFFFDDSRPNVEAARSLGLIAMLVEQPIGISGLLERAGLLD